MRISNKTLYAAICDIQAQIEELRDFIDVKLPKATVRDLDKPKRGRGRPRKER